MNMEFNKIFAALLVAGIVASLSGFAADHLVHSKELEENAYKIDVPEETSGGAVVEAKAEPVLALIAAADPARGEKISKACAACHSFDKGGANGVGPNLYGVVGATKQSVAGYAYSGVLNANGENVWTYAALNKFLWKPKKYAPGTKMNYLGLKKPEDRAAILAYLGSISGKGAPSAAEIAAEEAELAPPAAEEESAEEAVATDSE